MTPDLWKKVSEAWEAYFNQPVDNRAEFLEKVRCNDSELAAELETLLKQHGGAGKVKLDVPPSELLEQAGQSRADVDVPDPVTVDHEPDSVQSARDASTVPPEVDSAFDRAKTAAQLPDGVPAKAGRYIIEEKIGEGGMGAVLRVRDPDFDRTLAVKIMSAKAKSDADAQRRFLEEAKITGQLQHPGIPPVHEIGQLKDGLPFFAMKLIRGETLASLLKNRQSQTRQPAAQARDNAVDSLAGASGSYAQDLPRFLGIFGQICQTIGYAHSRGVIHRDLKPANIMVGAFGEVQVMDWGLAKVVRGPWSVVSGSEETEQATIEAVAPDQPRTTDQEPRTRAGVTMGTPAYMAPEQARGEIAELDPRADVFGLGAILSVILTGKPPFWSANRSDVLAMARRGDLAEAFARLKQNPRQLICVVQRGRCPRRR